MSWPVTMYYCTACDFEQGDWVTWGTREYVLNSGVRIPVHWHIGWCASCNGIVAVENLSMKIRMQDYRAAQRELSKFSRSMFGVSKHHKSMMGRLEDDSNNAIDALEMLMARKNPPHCLLCLSKQVHELNDPQLDDEAPDSPCIFNASNQHAGESKLKQKDNGQHWQHPECAGQIKTKLADGGLRIALRPSIQRFTAEGLLIDKEFVDGNSIPDSEYYDALSKSNWKYRAQSQVKEVGHPSLITSFLRARCS
ncbi:MAG: hypothetical protein PXX73_03290 [Sideroxydans sp.]|nr:hypothetical protein [Sideroxydans sp.]